MIKHISLGLNIVNKKRKWNRKETDFFHVFTHQRFHFLKWWSWVASDLRYSLSSLLSLPETLCLLGQFNSENKVSFAKQKPFDARLKTLSESCLHTFVFVKVWLFMQNSIYFINHLGVFVLKEKKKADRWKDLFVHIDVCLLICSLSALSVHLSCICLMNQIFAAHCL